MAKQQGRRRLQDLRSQALVVRQQEPPYMEPAIVSPSLGLLCAYVCLCVRQMRVRWEHTNQQLVQRLEMRREWQHDSPCISFDTFYKKRASSIARQGGPITTYVWEMLNVMQHIWPGSRIRLPYRASIGLENGPKPVLPDCWAACNVLFTVIHTAQLLALSLLSALIQLFTGVLNSVWDGFWHLGAACCRYNGRFKSCWPPLSKTLLLLGTLANSPAASLSPRCLINTDHAIYSF